MRRRRSGARSAAVLKIIDNNLSLAFSAPNYTVRENLTLATITVELTGVNATPVSRELGVQQRHGDGRLRLRHPQRRSHRRPGR